MNIPTKNSAVVVSMLFALPVLSSAQVTIFGDTFANGSTVQSATPADPTANSTAYQYFQQGATPTTPTIAAGDLHLQGRTTSSSISEVQALFTTSPVTLSTIGDFINLRITFANTQNIFPDSASTLNIGLYNSGGSKPVQGVRLDASGSGTGGAVGWVGYIGRIGGTGGASSIIITRPAQGAGITNPNQSQDLLFNGASGSSTFNNPTGTALSSNAGALAGGLTEGSTYTLDYKITLSAAGTLTINNDLYTGSTVSGSPLISETGTAAGATLLTTSFDGLALGWRYNSTSAASSIDISSITVTADIAPVPEPTTFALAGLGLIGFAFAGYRRFRS